MSRASRLTQEIVSEACSGLAQTGTKVTIANVRSWLMNNYGFSGNNNDLCPMVVAWKAEVKSSLKGGTSDSDAQLITAFNQFADVEVPADVKVEADRLIGLLYKSVYDRVDSQVGSDRIQEMQAEIDKLNSNQEEYYKMKAEYEGMLRSHTRLLTELVEANRMVNLQKVAEGEAMVGEMQSSNDRYEAMVNEVTDLKSQLEYTRSRKAEIDTIAGNLGEENERLRSRSNDLEAAVTALQEPDAGERHGQLTEQCARLTSRNLELATEKEQLEEQLMNQRESNGSESTWNIGRSLLQRYAQEKGIMQELQNPKKAAYKEIHSLMNWIMYQEKIQTEITE